MPAASCLSPHAMTIVRASMRHAVAVEWSLTKEAVDSHVDAVLRDCRTVKRLVEAMAEVRRPREGAQHQVIPQWHSREVTVHGRASTAAGASAPSLHVLCAVSSPHHLLTWTLDAPQAGCAIKRDYFKAMSCDTKTGGGFSLEQGVRGYTGLQLGNAAYLALIEHNRPMPLMDAISACSAPPVGGAVSQPAAELRGCAEHDCARARSRL